MYKLEYYIEDSNAWLRLEESADEGELKKEKERLNRIHPGYKLRIVEERDKKREEEADV